MTMNNRYENMKHICNTIITEEENKTITIPIKDMIWAMLHYTYERLEIEEQILADDNNNILLTSRNHQLLVNKECSAAREDELARLISHYSDFDTQKIHKETHKIIKEWYK